MSEIVLHSYRRCPFAIRVRMTLEEKGIPYRVIEESLADLSPELLSLHPEGKVPLLKHGGRVLYESAVITQYLDESFAGRPLMPGSPWERARVRLWTHWCDELFKPDLDLFKYRQPHLSAEETQALHERLKAHLGRVEGALSGAPYLLGGELTLADVHVFPFLRQFRMAKPEYGELASYPRLNAWLDGLLARPSFERVMARVVPKG